MAFVGDSILTASLERHFHQDGWGYSPESGISRFVMTDDGAIHSATYKSVELTPPPSPTYAGEMWHHVSHDSGNTWVSENITDAVFESVGFESSYAAQIQLVTDGINLLLLFRSNSSGYGYIYYKTWNGSVWSDTVDTELYCRAFLAAEFYDGVVHLVWRDGTILVRHTKTSILSGSWTYAEDVPIYHEEEALVAPAYVNLTPYRDKLLLAYMMYSTVWYTGNSRLYVQEFDGSDWGEPVCVDGLTGVGEWDDDWLVWETYVDGGVVLHEDINGVLHAAWVMWTDPGNDVTALCLRSFDGETWGEVSVREWDTAQDPEYFGGVFVTPALASDKRGVVLCLCGCYSPSWADGVCYATLLPGQGWSEDYGMAVWDNESYVIYQPSTLSKGHIQEGVVFSDYQNASWQEEWDGTEFRTLTVDYTPPSDTIRLLPEKVRHIWLSTSFGKCVLRNKT